MCPYWPIVQISLSQLPDHVRGVNQKKLNPLRNDRFYRLDQDKKIAQEETRAGARGQRVHIGHLLKYLLQVLNQDRGGAPKKTETPLEMTDFVDSIKTKKLPKRRPESR